MKKYFNITIVIGFNILTGCNDDSLNEKIITKQEYLPLREVKEVRYFIEQIKSDSSTYYNIVKKANQKNKPVEELIEEEAEVLESRYADIIRIENLIIKNPTWFEEVQNKAKQEKMSIDSAIKREAMRHISITRK